MVYIDMACGNNYRNIFGLLIFMSIACVIFQYRFNFSSISQCLSNQKRFVATRVVERVYFEMPNAPTTASGQGANQVTTESPSTVDPVSTPLPTMTVEPTRESTRDTCNAKQHVLFLKTHKTGSSTITNILNRYADWNNLTMLLPKGESYYSFDWPNKFRLSFARNLHGKRPNILANHARYSRKSMNVLFPREDTFYLTVLRHPVKQWESTFNYMSFPYILNILRRKDPLDFFLNNPPSYENIIQIGRKYPSLYLIKNPQFFDLGLDYKYYDNNTMIRRAIKTVEKDFDLVILMEYFDESLTLLKRRLCWEIDDVVYFKMNERLNKNKRKKLTGIQKRKIYRWNNADAALYDYFSKKFWQEIKKEGPEFYEDLAELRARKDYYFRTCIEKEAVEEAYTAVYVKGFAMRSNLTGVTKTFCERMLRNELNYQDIFKERQRDWMESLEGVTIENFNENEDEADVTVVDPIPPGIEGEAFRYEKPTRAPKTQGTKKPKRKQPSKRKKSKSEDTSEQNISGDSDLVVNDMGSASELKSNKGTTSVADVGSTIPATNSKTGSQTTQASEYPQAGTGSASEEVYTPAIQTQTSGSGDRSLRLPEKSTLQSLQLSEEPNQDVSLEPQTEALHIPTTMEQLLKKVRLMSDTPGVSGNTRDKSTAAQSNDVFTDDPSAKYDGKTILRKRKMQR